MSRSYRLLAALAAAVLGLAPAANAQPSFTEVTPTGSPLFVTNEDEDFWVNAVAPADIDGDGDLDLAVLGFYVVYFGSVEDRLVLFMNEGPDVDGNWTFDEVAVPLGTVYAGASDLAWGDYDTDGDPDLAVGSEGQTVLYRNDGGTLALTNTVLPGYYEDSSYTGSYDLRSITWADMDNDGDLDLLLPSVFDDSALAWATKLMRNDGPDGAGGWSFSDLIDALDPTVHAQSAWADDDGDGDLDLFLTNIDPYTETGFIRRFRNDGAGAFVGQDLLGIRVEYGLADWGDYDADGDLDILVVGNIQETDGTYTTVLRVYRNDGGTYAELTLTSGFSTLAWLDLHAATWADYDSDGDTDLLLTGSVFGEGEILGRSEIFGNDGGVFTALGVALPAPISSIGRGGSFTWFDLDSDGDLDYFVAGAYYVPGGNGLVEAMMHLYRNDAPGTNAPPATPGSPTASVQGDVVGFSWGAAGDDHTPAAAITYDLDVRPSGQASATGHYLPEPGDVSAMTGWELRGLPPGSYEFRVRAVDNAFNAGPAAQGTFTVGGAASGPPGVPDGTDGTGMTVKKRSADGRDLVIYWDAASCSGDDDHHLVFGYASQLPSSPGGSYALDGSTCDLGPSSPFRWLDSPEPAAGPSGLVWFLVLASDGAATEGSWGADSAGAERVGPGPGGASAVCGITTKSLANTCGQ